MSSTTDRRDQLLIKRVAEKIIRMRTTTGLPLGLATHTPAHFAQVFASEGGGIRHCLLPFAFQYVPAGMDGQSWELLLSLWNTEAADEVCCLYVLSRLDDDDERASPDEHDLFAAACAVNYALRRSGGREAIKHFTRTHGDLPGVWSRRGLDELLVIAKAVWRRTDPRFSAGSEELQQRAREVFESARAARLREDYSTSVPAYEQALLLAGQAGSTEIFLHAHLGLGKIAKQRGNAPAARRWFAKCERHARRLGRIDVAAMALHDQFSLAVDIGDFAKAERLGKAAYKAYGPRHEALFRLAHDQAYCWLLQGRFTRALTVFEETVPHLADPGEQMMVWACIARAAGGAGNRSRFEAARNQVELRAQLLAEDHHLPQALLDVGRGAGMLGDVEIASEFGRAALKLAEHRGQGLLCFEAEAFLESRCGGPAPARMLVPDRRTRRDFADVIVSDLRRLLAATE